MDDTQPRATTLFDIDKNIELGDIDYLMSQHKILIQLRETLSQKYTNTKLNVTSFLFP